MLKINRLHHVAIICSNYTVSKLFYTKVLGFEVIAETYREERDSYKLDLKVGDHYQIELFSFPDTPARLSHPEANGLRHLAFEVDDVAEAAMLIGQQGIATEPIRVDEVSGKRFTFFSDPDGLPLEFYEK